MNKSSLTHVDLIASLSDEDRNFLIEKSDSAGLTQLFTNLIALVITGAWIAFGFSGWQFVLVVHGIMLAFLFAPLHETIHASAFRTYRLNVWVSHFCGFILLLPPQWFRYFHFAHHRHTNDLEKDPELASPRPSTIVQYVWHTSGLPYWKSQIYTLISNAAAKGNDQFVPPRGKSKVTREARVYLLLYVTLTLLSAYFASSLLLWIWILPVLFGQPFLRLVLLAEHLFCPPVSNMLRNSRTTFTTKVMRWLSWNMAFHAEHHAYPAVPFYQLPEFHKFTNEHILIKQSGYAAFHAASVSKLVGSKD